MSETSPAPAPGGGGNPVAALGRKLGPLPVWAWAALIAVIAWGIYLRTRTAKVLPSAQYVADVVPDSTGISGAGPAQNANQYDGVNLTSNGRPLVQDNGSWAMQASNDLVASGKYSVAAVSNALDKYLSGKEMTEQEAAIVSNAIAAYGQPPSGVLPIRVAKPAAPSPVKPAPKPVPKPVPKPAAPKAPAKKPTGSFYTVRRGDSLSAIAMRFYGKFDWQKLWNDAGNRKRIGTNNPHLIHPGTRLWIPAK